MGGGVLIKVQNFRVGQGGDHRSPWEVKMRDGIGHKLAEILQEQTIGGHGRWSPDEGTTFLSMPRWRPWEHIGGGDEGWAQTN